MKINRPMDKLVQDVAAIAASIEKINLRIESLENGSPQPTPRLQEAEAQQIAAQAHPAVQTLQSSENEIFDIQSCYNAIKSSLASQKIPPSLSVSADKTGVRRADQPVHNILIKVSKFSETIIKIIQSPDYSDSEPKRLEDILTVTTALVQVLQEETTALVVQGSFDDGVAKFFRSLQRTNNFSADSLENLRAAASIAAVYRPQHQRGRGGAGGGYHQRGQGYPGQWRSGFRRRGGQGRGQGFASATAPAQQRDDE